MPGIQLPTALVLPLPVDLPGLGEQDGEGRFQRCAPLDPAATIADQTAKAGAQELQLAIGPPELLGADTGPFERDRLNAELYVAERETPPSVALYQIVSRN